MTALILFLSAASLHAATVAHYKFEGRLDAPVYELTDSSGNGHHGRVIGQEQFELTSEVPPYPGLAGAALDLRGRLDYAIIPHHRDFAPTGDWTIEFFVKADLFHQEHGGDTNIAGPFAGFINTNLSYTILAKQNTNQPTRFGSAWAFHYLPVNGWVVFTISQGPDRGEVLLASTDLRDGEWHHIAVVFAATQEYEIRLFQDGFQTGSSNIGNTPFSWGEGPIYIGAWARQNSTFAVKDRNFDGYLDEIRFSDAALTAEGFVVDFRPFLFPPIPVEALSAVEIEFQGESGKIYRIDQLAGGAWTTLGYALADLADGSAKSFFHRREFAGPLAYRVLPDSSAPGSTIAFKTFDAVELRFPTEPGQTYTVTGCESLKCADAVQTFILGDGAKMSYFERATGHTRIYKVERY